MGGSTEPSGDAVAVSALVHALHHPVAAGLNPGPGGLRQLHLHPLVVRRDRRHLRDRQGLAAELHDRPPVLLHHALDLVEVAPGHRLRRRAPVQRVISANVAVVVNTHTEVGVAISFLCHVAVKSRRVNRDLWNEWRF